MVALVALLVVSRVFVVGTIGSMPDMEPFYIENARQLFETQNVFDLYLAPGYSVLLYAVNAVFGDWQRSSQAIYVIFSALVVLVCYAMAKALFDVETARYTLLILIFLPNLTSAVAGYSHAVVPAMMFLYLAAYTYWLALRDASVWKAAACGACLLLATVLRPDNILYVMMFVVIFAGVVAYRWRSGDDARALIGLGVMVAIVSGGSAIQYRVTQARSSSPYGTVLGNARYSYITYTHTLSLRAVGFIDEKVAERLGAAAFGPGEENGFSIARAMARNPREAARNVTYNLRSLLKEAGNPLFIPVFLYPLLGIGLVTGPWGGRWHRYAFLGSLLIPCLAVVTLFHVEIRYMSSLVPPLVLVMAAGVRDLNPRVKRCVVTALVIVLAGVFTASVFHFRDARSQVSEKHDLATAAGDPQTAAAARGRVGRR